MGRTRKPLPRENYSSLPSHEHSSADGDIEIPPLFEDHAEEEYDVVYSTQRFSIWTIAVLLIAAAAALTLTLLVATNIKSAQTNEQLNLNSRLSFPSDVLFGGAISDDEYNNAQGEDFPPPYDIKNDFRNAVGNIPPYWENTKHLLNSTNSLSDTTSWGPCYPPSTEIDWREQVLNETPYRSSNDEITYSKVARVHGGKISQLSFYSGNNDVSHNLNLAGHCRPGFLIIGQAKCGTSSLYHYLTGHPRVLPATQKQINYFKYMARMPMDWYLSNFPSTQSFLARGALMTGESSPSYFPYPEVPDLIYSRTRAANEPHPKIIAIVRDPIYRSMSSYKYNYVDPALKLLMGSHKRSKTVIANIQKGMTEEYYKEHHLFTFEELVRAEIRVLKECLQPGGLAESMSREKYGPPHGIFAKDFMNSSKSLVNADEFCYGNTISDTIPLDQWADLIKQNPDKVINGLDYHLIRSIVGRSIYFLFLDWWYKRFAPDDFYMVCTEDLHFAPEVTMLNISLFLGLPEFDFTNVTGEGMYNVGVHQGYDTVTTWDAIENKTKGENNSDIGGFEHIGYDVGLSDELKKDLLEFFRPYNEELFRLTGKRCQWE